MYRNAVVYQGKTWRYALFHFVCFCVLLLVLLTYWKQYTFSDFLFLFVPVALAFGITFYYQAPHITVHIIVSNDTVAAPAPDSGRMKAASVQDIDLAHSRAPSFFRSGYLALSDGGRLILPWLLFNNGEAAAMLKEIARRQGDGAGVRKG